jgi:threonine dehydratase
MSRTIETIRPIELREIREAGDRIANTIVRTPLVKLELGPDYPEIWLKLENLQPINAYKLRGAANAVAILPEAERELIGEWADVRDPEILARLNHAASGVLGGPREPNAH